MNWKKNEITTELGERVNAQAPIIVSASRSTDIPAFYSEWFFDRLKKGCLKWKNPFNGVPLYVSFANIRLIVFWSKNPNPIIKHLNYLDEKNINYYFQFSLNDYYNEKLEAKVPNIDYRIETFIKLSEKIGKEKIIWRFDPYILTDTTGVDELLKRTEYIGDKLKKQLNKKWNLEVGTCAEKIDLDKYDIIHNKCIDDDLMIKLFSNDKLLMDFLGYKPASAQLNLFAAEPIAAYKIKNLKDKGQRELCGCIFSKDIGQYNTCPHECVYCYANTSKEVVSRNYNAHKANPNNETIIGE
ncbi:MAG: hypothetical protein B6I20_08780 [Bacteroidetes bacterium 4572_117]|nr:MAG: hypothetical protein B6I20_08780 [Bacteroidetes bacterium 4572_117]